jgi:hypothetical protein
LKPCRRWWPACLLVLLLNSGSVAADAQVGRVYHPYVEPLEREVELRANVIDDSGYNSHKDQKYWLAYGFSPLERWFVEAYMIARKNNGEALKVSGFELEGLWQLTEQGEYWADWGMLFEVERESSDNIWELAVAGLAEKEFGPTSLTANLYLIYEYGGGVDNELETYAALQWRWRFREYLEPAMEYYKGDELNAIGPVALGMIRSGRQKVKWELGPMFGVDSKTPDLTWRMLLEYEF